MGSSVSKTESVTGEDLRTSKYVQQIIEARQNLTGWERLKNMVTRDQYGDTSPELQRVTFGTMLSFVVGAGWGAMARGRIAYQEYMRSNLHEVYESPLQAKRKLQDNVTLGMGRGGFRIAWRLSLFTFLFLGTSTVVSVYRGKSGILDHVVGGGAAGLLYKTPQGPKAMVAGGVIGSFLGLVSGAIFSGIARLSGQTIDSANLHYYHLQAKRSEKKLQQQRSIRETLNKYDKKLPDDQAHYELTKFHDQLHADLNKDSEGTKLTSQMEINSKKPHQESVTNENKGVASKAVVTSSNESSQSVDKT